MNKLKGQIKKIEDFYEDVSENPLTMWFRAVLQSLDVEFNPSVGVKVSVGQALERFMFTQAEINAQKRQKESILDLNSKLKNLTINQETLGKNVEEYSKLVLRFCGMTGSQSYVELRNAYTNQMAHFFDVKYAKETNRLFYQQLLFRLTIDHLYLLNFSEEYLGEDYATGSQSSRTLNEAIISKFVGEKGLEEPLVRGLIKDLDSMGLLNQWQSSALGGDIHYLSITDLGRKVLLQINS